MSENDVGDYEQCGECGREGFELMKWGDRGELPPICNKCYFNPGWYRDADTSQ